MKKTSHDYKYLRENFIKLADLRNVVKELESAATSYLSTNWKSFHEKLDKELLLGKPQGDADLGDDDFYFTYDLRSPVEKKKDAFSELNLYISFYDEATIVREEESAAALGNTLVSIGGASLVFKSDQNNSEVKAIHEFFLSRLNQEKFVLGAPLDEVFWSDDGDKGRFLGLIYGHFVAQGDGQPLLLRRHRTLDQMAEDAEDCALELLRIRNEWMNFKS
ncbi:hypothetical protein WDW37_18775 [Bdellovibrionota bacterium FG-1]